MIPATDLRIGNWVTHLDKWSYRNPAVGCFDFQWSERDWYAVGECTMSLENIEPIPLTAELLEKIGFKKYPNDYDLARELDEFWFTIDLNTGIMRVGGYEEPGNTTCQMFETAIPPLHGLQNLIFALTGKELPISL